MIFAGLEMTTAHTHCVQVTIFPKNWVKLSWNEAKKKKATRNTAYTHSHMQLKAIEISGKMTCGERESCTKCMYAVGARCVGVCLRLCLCSSTWECLKYIHNGEKSLMKRINSYGHYSFEGAASITLCTYQITNYNYNTFYR